jgi:hypothetical protein
VLERKPPPKPLAFGGFDSTPGTRGFPILNVAESCSAVCLDTKGQLYKCIVNNKIEIIMPVCPRCPIGAK